MVANCGEDLFFFALHLISGKTTSISGENLFFLVFIWFRGKMTSISGEDLFLVFGLIQFRQRKYITSTKLFVKLVKAAKASPHAKFYNLSTVYVSRKIHVSLQNRYRCFLSDYDVKQYVKIFFFKRQLFWFLEHTQDIVVTVSGATRIKGIQPS